MRRTNDDLCPVTALLSYLFHHGDAPGPLFQWDDHTPLSKSKFVDHVCRALLAPNIPVHLYTGHSFHIGAARTAASAGIKDSTVQTLGHWKSAAYLLNIRLNPSHLTNLSTTWLTVLFNCHWHIRLSICTYHLLSCYTFTYQLTAKLLFIACLG